MLFAEALYQYLRIQVKQTSYFSVSISLPTNLLQRCRLCDRSSDVNRVSKFLESKKKL